MNAESRALTVHLEWVGSAAVLTVGGEVDVVSAPQMQSEIANAFGKDPELLVVDLSNVSFFGSAGLGVLLFASETAAERTLRVVASAQVRRPIEITGIDAKLELFDTLPDALTSGETTGLT